MNAVSPVFWLGFVESSAHVNPDRICGGMLAESAAHAGDLFKSRVLDIFTYLRLYPESLDSPS